MERSELLTHVARIQSAVSNSPRSTEVAPYISDSWRRCLVEHDMNPAEHREPVLISSHQLKERCEALEPLLSIATPEMTNLYQQVAGSGYAVLLTDIEGIVLQYVGDPGFDAQAAGSGLAGGAVWDEKTQGTNGIGTCLVERKPVVVHHDQHFFAKNTILTCAAAPIRNPEGVPIAVLDASSTSRMAQQHTLALVNMSAQLIENRVFLQTYRRHFIARFHSRCEFVSTLGEGLLSFDDAGRILAANRSALFQLDIATPAALDSVTVRQLFNMAQGTLVDHARRQPFHPIILHEARYGRRFFATIQLPEPPIVGMRTGDDGERGTPARIEGNTGCALDALDLGDPEMARSVARAKQLLNRDIPLLLYGPTGSGKGVFAKALHMSSSRADRAFVAVNCAAIPETLIESELFGYKPGAFTGADRRGSPGKIVQAHRGTLFLDEIGDMPLSLQARLLRVLEEKEVVPLGGSTPISVDISIVSATHRDLESLIQAGAFREDLYYRLDGVTLTLPPLRDRSDRRELIMHILACQAEASQRTLDIDEDALILLMNYGWPGNVRELSNALRLCAALCSRDCITMADIPEKVRTTNGGLERRATNAQPVRERLHSPLTAAEYTTLLKELQATHWNVAKTARKLKMSRNTLYRKMRRFGIDIHR